MKFKACPTCSVDRPPLSRLEAQMARKSVSGFAEAGAAMAQQQLDDNDMLNLFSAIGRVVSKRFLLKRPGLSRPLPKVYQHFLTEGSRWSCRLNR